MAWGVRNLMSTQANGQEVLEIHEAVRQGQRQVLQGLRGGLPEARGERLYRADADGVGLTSLTTGAPRVLWWATRHNERRARDPLTINNTQSTYDPALAAEWSNDGRDTCDGRERS